MNCKQFRGYIPLFFNDKLDIDQAEQIIEHAGRCAECSEEMEIMHLLEIGLKQLDEDGRNESYDFDRILKDKLAQLRRHCREVRRFQRIRGTFLITANIVAALCIVYQIFEQFGGLTWLESYF